MRSGENEMAVTGRTIGKESHQSAPAHNLEKG